MQRVEIGDLVARVTNWSTFWQKKEGIGIVIRKNAGGLYLVYFPKTNERYAIAPQRIEVISGNR